MHPLVFGADAEQPFFLHTWSLSLEEQFYLVWPLVIARLTMGRTALALAVGLIGVGVRLPTLSRHRSRLLESPVLLTRWFRGRSDPGGRISPRANTPLARSSAGMTLLACAVMVFDVVVSQSAIEGLTPLRMLLSQVAVAIVILHLVSSPQSRVSTLMRRRTLVYIGLLSYALYLWHFPIFETFTAARMGDMPPVLRHGAKYLLTVVCAVATYHLLEQPISKRRSRLRAAEST